MILRFLLFTLTSSLWCTAQIKIQDSISQFPVSYATVSFGDGHGIFADDEGLFIFNKRLYKDVDSLFITALGYKDLRLGTTNLPKIIKLLPQADELDEVILSTISNRKFKIEQRKPYLDDDYYNCWLPTIESEIAVFFPKQSTKDIQLTTVTFPIALESKDWKKRKQSNSDKKRFSTLFKVTFYENRNGFPGDVLNDEIIVFEATEKNGDAFTLDVEDYNIYMPESGFFVSLQVLGYTDKQGKLLPNKKYKEIPRGKSIVKIPTNFRPLLPFTDKIKPKHTYIKRVFIQGNNWIQFDTGKGIKSSLLKSNLFNYGIGIKYKVYKS